MRNELCFEFSVQLLKLSCSTSVSHFLLKRKCKCAEEREGMQSLNRFVVCFKEINNIGGEMKKNSQRERMRKDTMSQQLMKGVDAKMNKVNIIEMSKALYFVLLTFIVVVFFFTDVQRTEWTALL